MSGGSGRKLFDVRELLADDEPPAEELTRAGTEVAFGAEVSTQESAFGAAEPTRSQEELTRLAGARPRPPTQAADRPPEWGPAWSAEPHTTPEDLEGKVVLGYRVESRIGAGSYAHVYRARSEATAEVAALKVLKQRFGADPAALRRFRQEGRALVALRHPHLVQIFEVGELEDGRPFHLMELLEGETLAAWLRRTKPVPFELVTYLAEQLVEGLRALHEAGLVHRDLKPGNVMLCAAPLPLRVKILDLGLVRQLEPSEETRLTPREHILGTPAYMAPEQIQTPDLAGPAADLYALGIMLYELLVGRRPFDGTDARTLLDAHLFDPPPPLPPAGGLERLVMGLLEKYPARRPSLDELSGALERLRRAPMRRRRRWAAAGVGGLAATLGALLWRLTSEPTPPEEAPPPVIAAEPTSPPAPRVAEPAPPSEAPPGAEVEAAAADERVRADDDPPRPEAQRTEPRPARRARPSATERARAPSAPEPAPVVEATRASKTSSEEARRLRLRRIVGLLEELSRREPGAHDPYERRYLELRRALVKPDGDLSRVDEALSALEQELSLRATE